MTPPPKLIKEIEDLGQTLPIEVIEEPDSIDLVFRNFDVGEGFNLPRCDLLVRMPRTYPDAGPDMFWTTPELTLANGQVPQAAEHMETYIGRRWRRFSWHRRSWNPTVDNLVGYLEFVRHRLREKR